MSRAEPSEADRAFVEEFRRAVEADFAEARRGAHRHVLRLSAAIALLIAIGVLLGRFLLLGVTDVLAGALVGIAGTSGMQAVVLARRRATNRLSDVRDPRLVGTLAEYCFARRDIVRNAALSGFWRSLPCVQPEHRVLLTDAEVRALVRVMCTHPKAEGVLALLQAFRHIGDGRALPAVKALASGELLSFEQGAWTRPTRDRVRHAALECLPFLEQRAEEDRQRATLLRAAQAPAEGDGLLRPAHGSGEAEAEQLLRPLGEE